MANYFCERIYIAVIGRGSVSTASPIGQNSSVEVAQRFMEILGNPNS